MDNFGKVRVYDCICGATPVRPLHGGDQKPCDHCGNGIVGMPYRVEDHQRFVDGLIASAKSSGGKHNT